MWTEHKDMDLTYVPFWTDTGSKSHTRSSMMAVDTKAWLNIALVATDGVSTAISDTTWVGETLIHIILTSGTSVSRGTHTHPSFTACTIVTNGAQTVVAKIT